MLKVRDVLYRQVKTLETYTAQGQAETGGDYSWGRNAH